MEERIEKLRKALLQLGGLPEVYASERAYQVVNNALDEDEETLKDQICQQSELTE